MQRQLMQEPIHERPLALANTLAAPVSALHRATGVHADSYDEVVGGRCSGRHFSFRK
jgi:hypothetical protein